MKTMKFAVIGNPVVDGVSHVTEGVLSGLGLHKGDANTLDHAAMFRVGAEVEVELFQSGGSAANMAYTLCKLGHKVCFLGPLGTDPAGRHFFKEMVGAGLALNTPQAGYRTTELFVLVTPDGARTMAQPKPPTPSPDEGWLDETLLGGADWLVVEGYAARDWPAAAAAAAKLARQGGTKVALQLPAPQVAGDAAPSLLALADAGLDLILGNAQEYAALAAKASPAQKSKLEKTPHVVTQGGGKAEFVGADGGHVVEATRAIAKPVDSTGAGDAFAAGFLAVYAGGEEPAVALRRGHHLGGAVIQSLGPRLADPLAVWLGSAGQAE